MGLPFNLNRFGGGRKKRKYYCEVESLTSDGNQYIDIGIGVKDNTVFKAIFSVASSGNGYSYFGARNSSNERFQIVNSIGIGAGYYIESSVYPIANQKYEIEMHANGDMYLDGVKRNASTGTFSQVSFERNLWLFATNYYNSSVGPGASTFWKAQVFEGDALVRDLIPVLDWNMTPCMFDRVTEQLFYNAGSGNGFSYGREIHYVDYLETTGTQYIDCGLTGNQDTSTSITFQNTQVEKQGIVIGSRSSASSNNISTISPAASGGSNYNVVNDFGNYNTTRQIVALQAMTDKVTAYNSKSLRTVYNHETGVTNTVTTTYTGTFTTPTNIYIAFKSSGYASSQYNFIGEIYDCKIWDNGTLVRDYIPAIDETGKAYMFDRVSHTIYDNAGTGAFSYPAREVEYLESTGTQYIDTGFTPNQNTKTELDYKITTDLSSGFPLFGSRTSVSSNGYSYQRYGSGVMGGQYGSNISYSTLQI